jgi:Ni/Co efflux regulator RcnB
LIVTIRRLLAALLALAMAFAPLGMPAMAEAAMPAAHHGEMAGQSHCDRQPRPDQHHKAAGKDCCVAMCIAVVVPDGVAELPTYHASRERPASDLDRRGFLGEIATPPPKRS